MTSPNDPPRQARFSWRGSSGAPPGVIDSLFHTNDLCFPGNALHAPSVSPAMAVKTQVTDLEHLSQSQVSWLTGMSTYRLRAHSNDFKRNADGSYDAREVFQAMARLLGQVVIQHDEAWEAIEFLKNPANCKFCKNGIDSSCKLHGENGTWPGGKTVW